MTPPFLVPTLHGKLKKLSYYLHNFRFLYNLHYYNVVKCIFQVKYENKADVKHRLY